LDWQWTPSSVRYCDLLPNSITVENNTSGLF
jgi:hypothetical protein